jgi:hypothetical protein
MVEENKCVTISLQVLANVARRETMFCFRKKEHGKAEVWSSEFPQDMANLKSSDGIRTVFNIRTIHSLPKNKLDNKSLPKNKCHVNVV